MNDARRQWLERYFDGELSPADRDAVRLELAGDADAARYLDRLALLRRLAQAHDPATQPAPPGAMIGGIRPGRRRLRRPALVAVGALAASLLVITMAPWDRPAVRTPVAPRVVAPQAPAVVLQPAVALPSSGAPLEVELIRLANVPLRGPERAVRAVLSRSASSVRRSTAREILALELANGSPRAPSALLKATVSPGVAPPPPARRNAPTPRPHASSSPSA